MTSEKPDHRNSMEFEAVLADAGYDVELISFDGGNTEPPALAVQTVKDTIGASYRLIGLADPAGVA